MKRYLLPAAVFACLSVLLLQACTGSPTAKKDTLPVNDSGAVLVQDPCSTILKKKLSPESSDSSMSLDFAQLLACHYLDSFDLDYVVPNLIPEIMADNMGDSTGVSYQLIFDKVQTFHHTERYRRFRRQMHVLDSMRATVINKKNWKSDTILLAGLGMEKAELLHLEKVVRELGARKPLLTWGEALDSTDRQLRRAMNR